MSHVRHGVRQQLRLTLSLEEAQQLQAALVAGLERPPAVLPLPVREVCQVLVRQLARALVQIPEEQP